MAIVQKLSGQKRQTDKTIKYGKQPGAAPRELVPTLVESQVLLDQSYLPFAYTDGSWQCCQPAEVQALETLCRHNADKFSFTCQFNTLVCFMNSSELTVPHCNPEMDQ